jgi:hypothetical protein
MEVDVRNPTPIQPPPELVAGHRDSHHGHHAAIVAAAETLQPL